jgi:hypothetical protein
MAAQDQPHENSLYSLRRYYYKRPFNSSIAGRVYRVNNGGVEMQATVSGKLLSHAQPISYVFPGAMIFEVSLYLKSLL